MGCIITDLDSERTLSRPDCSFTKAAEAGNATAQYLIGLDYDTGAFFGLPIDKLKAIYWY
jgi:TPR repeat protein